jgi:hypothetical protein
MIRRDFNRFLFASFWINPAYFEADADASIQGQVTNAQGLPIARALVSLDDLMRVNSKRTETDEKGFYLLENVKPGRYSLRVEVKRMGCMIIPRLVVNFGETLERNFQFSPHGKTDVCKT